MMIKGRSAALQVAHNLLVCMLIALPAIESRADGMSQDVKIIESTIGLIGQVELGVSRVWSEGDTPRASLTTWDAEMDEEREVPVSVDSLVELGPKNHLKVTEIVLAGDAGAGFVRLRLQPE